MAQDAEEPARAPRSGRLFSAELLSARGGARAMFVRNLSGTGVGGRSENPPLKGERVEILLPLIGSVQGRVAWSHGAKFGVAFDAPIDPAQMLLPPPPPPKPSQVPARFRPETTTYRPGFRRLTGSMR